MLARQSVYFRTAYAVNFSATRQNRCNEIAVTKRASRPRSTSSRHHGIRHPAPLRRRSRQERFSGNTTSIAAGLTALHFAAVPADEIRRRTASGHFALERLKSQPCLALALVDQFDRAILRQRSPANRHRILTHRP